MSIPADDFKEPAPRRSAQAARFTAPRLASDLMPLLDCATLLVAAWLSTWACNGWLADSGAGTQAIRSGTTTVVAILAAFMLYDRRFGSGTAGLRITTILGSHALRFVPVAAAAIAASALETPQLGNSFMWLAIWLGTAWLFTLLFRILAAAGLRQLQQRQPRVATVAIVGTGPLADRLLATLKGSQSRTTELLGVFDDLPASHRRPGHVGSVEDLLALGRVRRIDWILVAKLPSEEPQLPSLVQRLDALAAPIGLCPQHIGLNMPCRAIDLVESRLPVILLADRPIRRWNAVIKAAEDFVGGAIITLLLLPLMATIAVAVRLSGPGPVIFRQRRHTLNNSEFDVYKFRTMHWSPAAGSGELQQTTRTDARVTRIGRFLRASSLDELPQLFNVLKGEMSLVGPRPHAVNMRTEAKLGPEITEHYPHRHRVKPGMTGWSQVNGARGATETVEQLRRRVELDMYYIDNWSLLLDMRILLLTLREVMKQTNAF